MPRRKRPWGAEPCGKPPRSCKNSLLGDPDFVKDLIARLTDKAGVPNIYGLVQGEANAIAPGKRPLSSMSPTIVSQGDQPVMVVGTPGGSRIITAVLHTIFNVVDYGMTVMEAIDAPRFHQQWLPEATNLERFAVSPDTHKLLEAMGHQFGAPSLGGKPVGANDPRRHTGLAAGY